MLKLRLTRLGRKKKPTYRLVVANSTSRRDGAAIDELGFYDPTRKLLRVDLIKANEWKRKGATPTETVATLLALVEKVQKEQGDEAATQVIQLPKKAAKQLAPAAAAAPVVEAPVDAPAPVVTEDAAVPDEAAPEAAAE
jgi:small subunit ribosomal protein S16